MTKTPVNRYGADDSASLARIMGVESRFSNPLFDYFFVRANLPLYYPLRGFLAYITSILASHSTWLASV